MLSSFDRTLTCMFSPVTPGGSRIIKTIHPTKLDTFRQKLAEAFKGKDCFRARADRQAHTVKPAYKDL